MIKTESKDLQPGGANFGRFLVTVFKGTLAAYVLLIICFALLAAVYTYTPIPDSYIKPAVNILTIASLVFGGCVSGKNVFGFGWLHGAATGFVYTIIRIALGYAVFGSYVPSSGIMPIIAVGVLAATVGGILGINLSGA